MRTLSVLFILTVSILLIGMVQTGQVGPMTSPSTGLQPPAAPDTAIPSDGVSSGISTDIKVTPERSASGLSDGWAIGALALVVIIAMLVMSAQSDTDTTPVRG